MNYRRRLALWTRRKGDPVKFYKALLLALLICLLPLSALAGCGTEPPSARPTPQQVTAAAEPVRVFYQSLAEAQKESQRSGKPILANDPHLEANRLPNVWCELVLTCDGRPVMGASMPGLPGILVGRSPDLAWGATYAFVDASDSWVEHCRKGCCYREKDDTWHPFQARKEIIKRKKKPPEEITFYENEHSVLDGDPHQEGYYLATRWAPGERGDAALKAVFEIGLTDSVAEAMASFGKIESAWSYVFADRHGDIGYQMTGLVPRRREGISGFVPLPGW